MPSHTSITVLLGAFQGKAASSSVLSLPLPPPTTLSPLRFVPNSLSGDILDAGDLLDILKGFPVILAAMFLLRGGLIYLEAPLLSLVGPRMSWQVRGGARTFGGCATTSTCRDVAIVLFMW